MKPIKITRLGILYTYIFLNALMLAIPKDIMSYGWAHNIVDVTAYIVPAMDKLIQAYEQNSVTGVALFFHALKWLLILLTLVLMIKPNLGFSGKEREWLYEAAKWRLYFCLLVLILGFWMDMQGNEIEDFLSDGVVDNLFRRTYLSQLSMSFIALLYISAPIYTKDILMSLFKGVKKNVG